MSLRARTLAAPALSALALAMAAPALAGTVTPVAPYVETGVIQQFLTGINNAGYTTGGIIYADGSAKGYLRDPSGGYTVFANTAYPAGIFTTGRAVSNSNTVIGYSSVPGGTTLDFREYQRTADGTITLLTRPSDGLELAGIAQGINDSGAIVGNYRSRIGGVGPFRNHGFILNGSSFTDIIDPRNAAFGVNARGIANDGTVVGFVGSTGEGFVLSGSTYTTLTAPGDDGTGSGTVLEAINNNGIALGGYSNADGHAHAFIYNLGTHTFEDIDVPGALDVTTWGINDFNQFVVQTDIGNFIYDPNGPSAPDGSTVFNPISGGDLPEGTSQFSFGVTTEHTYYIDPAFAHGFEYLSGTGPLFASVTAPTGVAPGDQFQLWLWNGAHYVFSTDITGGTAFSFADPVSRFEIRGIPYGLVGIPDGHFITGLTFASAGQFDGYQIALGSVPEPASWAMLIAGFGVMGAAARRRRGLEARA